jgi:PBP4 family serine-type D-alanyl-D-alanine carboxypeptidase
MVEEALQDSLLARSRFGIKVVSAERGDVIFQRDSYLLFHPASNMKLFTTAAFLKLLGPDYRFRTVVAADTLALSDSVLCGNLYVRGSGDPGLTTGDLWAMVQHLKISGVRCIEGDLVLDASRFDDVHFGAGWMWDDASSRSYPPISAFIVNRNTIRVYVCPADSVGAPVDVDVQPATGFITIENNCVTSDQCDSTLLSKFNIERKWKTRENVFVLDGGLAIGTPVLEFEIEIENPIRYFGELMASLLRDAGIELSGEIVESSIPDTFQVLVEHLSPPVQFYIGRTNKDSDNLYAEALLKTLAAECRTTPASARDAIYEVRILLSEFGVDTTSVRFADGSGVSRYNLVTPETVVDFLMACYRDPEIWPEMSASLAVAGRDGTLKNRMLGTAAEGRLRAKTGTMTGVSALSGFTTTAGGETLIFSMMVEHFLSRAAMVRKIQDRIGVLLSEFAGER